MAMRLPPTYRPINIHSCTRGRSDNAVVGQKTKIRNQAKKGTPVFGCLTAWILAVPFSLWSIYFIFTILQMHYWYSAIIIKGLVEPFLN